MTRCPRLQIENNELAPVLAPSCSFGVLIVLWLLDIRSKTVGYCLNQPIFHAKSAKSGYTTPSQGVSSVLLSGRSRVRIAPGVPARRKRHIACDEFFMHCIKNSSCAHSAAPRFRTGFAPLDSGSGSPLRGVFRF